MNFAENLQKLRKNAGLSQEALAEKLDVTRQSVSKWESSASYPEMDKLISICKIFDVDMETLLNGNVLTEEEIEKDKKEQTTGKEIFNRFDTFMKKIIYFFDSMSAKELISFLVTILLLIIIIAILRLPFDFFSEFISDHIFLELGTKVGPALSNIWTFIIELIYVFFSIILFIYVIKTKYIDKIEIEKVTKKKKIIINEEDSKEQEEKEVIEVIKTNHSISDTFTQIIVYFMKFIAICFLFGIGITLIGFAICLGLSISFLIKGLPVLGITLGLGAALLISAVIFIIPLNFVINHKNSFKKIGITLLIAFMLIIIGTTSFILEIFKFTYIDEIPPASKLKTSEIHYQMNENLNTKGIYYDDITYKIDNNLEDKIKIETSYYDYLIDTTVSINEFNNTLHLYRDASPTHISIGKLLETIGKDLKKNTIYNYEKIQDIKIIISGTEENIAKLKENNKHYEIDWNY